MKQLDHKKLKEILVPPGYISEKDFEVTRVLSENKKIPLEKLLVERQLIEDKNLGQAIAQAFDFYFTDLTKEKISPKLLDLIPEAVAGAQQAVFFRAKDDELHLATTDPKNYEFIEQLKKKTGKKIVVYYTTQKSIEGALKSYKSDVLDNVLALIADLHKNPQNETNVVRLVNLFLEHAHANRASDIHLEPLPKEVAVRFRIDGVLHQITTYSLDLHLRIVSRIKIMARLRTDEHGAAQDGRFEYKVNNAAFDVRTSILPVANGENVVLRLLSEKSRRLELEELGLLEDDLKVIHRSLAKTHGAIFAVGPTGSGKTTTLYGILQILNKPEINIMTIEDPVEYNVEHVQQTQVNPSKNLTFATGLRSIVRQDPNVIMVGEIRDNDTASIAVNAAMTGHLVLSTLHSNDAATTFPRLLEMGIEPFLAASSINVVVAQRLVRKICDQCRASYVIEKKELEILKTEQKVADLLKKIYEVEDLSKIRLYRGQGCKACGFIGYSGRIGIFEVLEITDVIRPLITKRALAAAIYEQALKEGMKPIVHDGLIKIYRGVTTLEEVIRVSKT